jgi:hypothetical protein
MLKGAIRHQVRIKKTNESELQMTCRKANRRYQNQVALLTWDKSMSYLCYCVGGIRHGSSVSLIQAFVWNLGTYRGECVVCPYRDGVLRSSDDISESLWSKGSTLISFRYESTIIGRSSWLQQNHFKFQNK